MIVMPCHITWNWTVFATFCRGDSTMCWYFKGHDSYHTPMDIEITQFSLPPNSYIMVAYRGEYDNCKHFFPDATLSWWRHQMETFSALLALFAGHSPVAGEFPSQRPVTRSFGVFFDLHVNNRLSKQSGGWWFETPSRSLWRYCNDWSFYNGDGY